MGGIDFIPYNKEKTKRFFEKQVEEKERLRKEAEKNKNKKPAKGGNKK
jgi:hypothetical protein